MLDGGSRLPHADDPMAIKRRSGILASFEEGAFAQVFLVLTGGKFLVDLTRTLGGTASHLGIVHAIPSLVAPLQIVGAYLCAWMHSRRRVMIPAALINRQVWWVVLAALFLPMEDDVRLWLFIGLLFLSSLAGTVVGNTWTSWIADLIPERARGRIISSRNAMLLVVTAVVDFIASEFRDRSGWSRTNYFALILGIAALCGLRTLFIFRRQWDPPLSRIDPPPLKQLLRESLQHPGVRRLITALSVWNIAVGVAVSFWIVHFTEYLKLPFTTILIYTQIIIVLRFLCSNLIWGPVIDRAGSLPVVVSCGIIISMLPILYLFMPPGNLILYWVDAVLSGVVWSGFDAAIFNLPIQVVPKRDRAFHLAILGGIGGIASGGGALLGGFMAQRLEGMDLVIGDMHYVNYHVMFLISGVLRAACILLLRRVPDSRSRGVRVMLETVGTGVTKIVTNPQLLLFLPRRTRTRRATR